MIMPTVKTRIFALGCLFELASAPVVQTVAQNGQYIYDVQDGEADIFGLHYDTSPTSRTSTRLTARRST